MAYRVKDLMINIIGSEAKGPHGGTTPTVFCPNTTNFCPGISPTLTHTWTTTPFCPTATQGCLGISGTTSLWMFCPQASCITGSPTAPTGPNCPQTGPDCTTGPACRTGLYPWSDPAAAAEQLAMLKAQLKEALEEVERQEKIANEQAQPQTVAEVDELEAKLTEALAELRKRKSELKKE